MLRQEQLSADYGQAIKFSSWENWKFLSTVTERGLEDCIKICFLRWFNGFDVFTTIRIQLIAIDVLRVNLTVCQTAVFIVQRQANKVTYRALEITLNP